MTEAQAATLIAELHTLGTLVAGGILAVCISLGAINYAIMALRRKP